MAGLGKTRGASSYGKKPKVSPPPPEHSGGTSGNLTIPGYQPKTPTGAPYSPTEPGHATQDFAEAFGAKEAHEAAQAEHHEAKVQRAEERQKRIVDRYVTKAYSPKQPKAKSSFSLNQTSSRVRKAKGNVSATREKLLSHPAVQKANEEGKVVGPKGLTAIRRESKALSPAGPLTHPRASQPGEANRLAKKYPGVTKLKELQTVKEEEGGLSPSDIGGAASSVASGAKGLYEGIRERENPNPVASAVGQEAKNVVELAEKRLPWKALPEPAHAPTAQELEVASNLAIPSTGSAATRVAEEAAPALATKALHLLDAAKAAPDAARSLPDVLKSSSAVARQAVREAPGAARQAVKEAPAVAKTAAKAAPGVAGRQAAKGAEGAFYSVGGLAALGALHKGGLNVPGGAILEGQARAVGKDPLKVLSSTANLAPGLLTGAFQLPVAAGASAVTGSTAPLEGALKEQGNFFKHFAETYGSSDASKIEKATLEEGLLPEVLAAPLFAKGIKVGKDFAKSKGLDLSESIKSRRAPLTDVEGNVLTHEHGGAVKKGRLRTGDETKLTRGAERANHRREEAFHAATTNDLTELDFARRRAEVDKYARKAAGDRVPIRKGLGPKGKDTLYARAPDFIPFLVRAGIDLSKPDKAAAEIAHYASLYRESKPAHELGASPETLTARDAIDYFQAFPEKLKDKNLAKAVEAYRAMATGEKGLRSLSISERNRYLAYATAHDLPLPEERIPHAAREHTDATTRAGAWEDLKAREKTVKDLRKAAKKKRDQAEVASPSRAAKLRREAKDTYAKAKVIEKGRQELLDTLKNYTRPWAKANPNAKRLPYDQALEKEFAEEARKGMTERGLNPEPAYVPDSTAVMKAAPDQSATGGKKPLEGAPKINEGYVWRNGISRQGYEHLMNEGILRPVSRAYQWEDWRRFRKERGIAYKGAYQHTGTEWQKVFDQGLLNPRDVALVPKQVVNRLEKNVKGGDPTEYEAALAEAMAARKVSPKDVQSGTVYEAFPKAAYDEKVAQSQKSPISPFLRKANALTSRGMLSTPSFIGAQLVAETAQGIAEVNPVRMMQGLRGYNHLTEEQKLRISGVSGETAKAIFSPDDLKTTLGSYDSKPFKDSLSFFRRNVFARSAKDIVTMKWAGEVNRATGSYTRRAVMTGQVARDVNGFLTKGRRLLNLQTEIQKKLDVATKGLRGQAKVDAALAYLADNPDLLTHYGKSLNDAMGGWTNLTRTGHFPESYRAAALLFYPYLRMSLQWPLKYAINHPIKATALTYLAAENNFALKEALHGEPSFLNYAQIPVYGVGPKGEGMIINLSRIAPGGNALTEAIQGSGSPTGALQPVLAAGITGFTGQGSFGEVEGGLGAHLKAAGAQILGLSPYVRALDTLRGQKASGQSEFGILAERANIAADPLAALEAKLKGSIPSQLNRSLLNFAEPTPTGRARDQAKLGHILEALSANSKSNQAKTNDKAKVLKMRAASEKAQEELKGLYKKYGVAGAEKAENEAYEYAHPYGNGSNSIYGKKSTTESIYGSSSSGGSSIYGEEKAPVIPHETSGVSLSLPSIPGLGGVTGALGSLVGGAKAEAAEPKGKKAPPTPPKAAHKITLSGPLTSAQKEFGKELARRTGLSPKTIGGWMLAEDSGEAAVSKQGEGDNNWLNIGPGAQLSSNPRVAAQETAHLINTGPDYGGIRESVGQGVGAQVAAIKASPWDGAEHYVNGIPTDLVQGSGHVKVPKRTLTKYQAGIRAAAELNKAELPYVWGGGHNAGAVNPGSGVDCSGAVSYVLQHMGVKLPGGVVSGEMGSYLKPGPGAVTVFYNAEHTFMRIGNKYFGTSESNPGGGAGFFPASVGKGEVESGNSAGTYSVGHVAGLGKKVASALGISPVKGTTGSAPSFPGVTLSDSGTLATLVPGQSTTQKKPGFSNKPIRQTPLKRLQEVERIFAGQAPTKGVIPGFEGTAQTQSAVPDLAAIGEAVEKSRRKLISA